MDKKVKKCKAFARNALKDLHKNYTLKNVTI